MLKKHLAACAAATALMTATAIAQTTPAAPAANAPAASQSATTSGAAAGQMTQMATGQMRGSELMGVDVYGSDNQKIGEIDELIVDQTGSIKAAVVGVGGFLGIGQKNVAIPFDQMQFMTEEQAEAMDRSNRGNTSATNTAGGVTAPASPTTGQPAATGSTGTAGATAGNASDDDDNEIERAMVRMTKADLQNAPEFRFRGDDRTRSGATTAPATPARPAGNAPQQ
jgi:sporulation protein YlmC with PRC-barrel domain